jgi:hypothetical protein
VSAVEVLVADIESEFATTGAISGPTVLRSYDLDIERTVGMLSPAAAAYLVGARAIVRPETSGEREARRLAASADPATMAAYVDLAQHRNGTDDQPERYDDPLHEIDWSTFWDSDVDEPERWLLEPVWAAGRGHALYAAAKSGKSYVALYLAVCIAIGRDLYGRPAERAGVLYVDAEMALDDVRERLEAFGLGPSTDLSHLHYLSLPTIPPLDTPHGSRELVERAVAVGARHVIFDTMARVVVGGENDSDTYRAFYRHTGHALKRAGIGYTRLDHAGKDLERGQRGSSGKADDVDVVTLLERLDDGVRLKATHRRMSWMPEKVDLTVSEDDEDGTVTIRLADGPSWPAGTAACAQVLDELGMPIDLSARAALRAYRDAGHRGTDALIRAAVRYRRERREGLA